MNFCRIKEIFDMTRVTSLSIQMNKWISMVVQKIKAFLNNFPLKNLNFIKSSQQKNRFWN